MRTAIVAMAAILTAAMPAYAADQFDLNCEGFASESPLDEEGSPIHKIYHIDLAAKRWCADQKYVSHSYKCDRAFPIVEVTPDQITFDKSEPHERKVIHYVLRTSGKYAKFKRNYYWNERGTCTVADFTGLPTTAF